MISELDLKHFDPLSMTAILAVDIPGLSPLPGGRKVREAFYLPDGNLLMIPTDKIGAFDQPHVTEHGFPAHYPGKGAIIAQFAEWGHRQANVFMPTDYWPVEPYYELIPTQYMDRAAVKIPYEKNVPVEFVCRSSCEGSMAEKAAEGKPVCGQRIPSSAKLGDLLPRPYFTPTTKAPKGQKDMPLTLLEYFELIGDQYVANFLYGAAVLLHLLNRRKALEKNLDRPDQKMEFGIFSRNAAVHHTGAPWKQVDPRSVFDSLCRKCGFDQDAWEKMPMFDITMFRDFAEENSETHIYRLIDEYGGTDDGRYRSSADTMMGRRLVALGAKKLGKVFLENYLCKERFRLASKRTGLGGYEKPASDVVTIPDSVLLDTASHNLMALLMLIS